jgi:hypothetical protein
LKGGAPTLGWASSTPRPSAAPWSRDRRSMAQYGLGGTTVCGGRLSHGSLARHALPHAAGLTPSHSRKARVRCGASAKPVSLAASPTEEPRSSKRRAACSRKSLR